MKTILNRSRNKMIGLGLLIVVLVLLGSAAIVQGSTQPADAPKLVQQRDFGSWSYVLKREPDNTLSAEVHFDANSIKGVQAFAAANKVLAKQLASSSSGSNNNSDQAEVLVMFKEPMDVDAYRIWARNSGIGYFKITAVMAIDGRLDRASRPYPPIQMSIIPPPTDALPQVNLEDAIKQAESASGGNITIRGVDGFQAKVDTNQLPAIAADPQVLIADVTANVVRNDVRTTVTKNAEHVDVYDPLPVFGILDLFNAQNSH
ncbi:MAG: hypothetical protein IVW55_14900 [Chloroflexi bacterium]|nr:hypothetical protein [Chloroflexota bacterium]